MHHRILSSLGSGGMAWCIWRRQLTPWTPGLAPEVPASSFSPGDLGRLERFLCPGARGQPPAATRRFWRDFYAFGRGHHTPFIVSWRRAETLRDCIVKGPLKVATCSTSHPLSSPTRSRRHGAGASPSRHQAGVDFLSDSNRVKVLDFGLAKLTASPVATLANSVEHGADSIERRTTRLHSWHSARNRVVHVVAEQARGELTHPPTLGAVLYEKPQSFLGIRA